MKVAHALVAGAVLLAGCGGKDGGEGGGNNGTEAATTVTEPVDENLYEDQSNRAVPVPAPVASAAGAIPATFVGRWGMTENDCDPARDDAKGLMVVEPGTLRFYESRAAVASASAAGDRLALRLSYTGEGQRWTAEETLTLLDEGRTLVRDQRTPASSLRYQRCPA